ncbi:hypothetical protein MYX77_03210 [Acidobacteriia bacterium AH_259_A11_L15]|nr:hypothetical protein [Acidobacteriia bacterium AH_259_A11_L15]
MLYETLCCMGIRRDSPLVQILLALLLTLIPWSFPSMPIKWRCILWLSAWILGLHLVFSLTPFLMKLPLFVKVALAVGITGFASASFYYPVVEMWREEKANALTGQLRPKRDKQRHDDVVFQIGPNAKAWFTWTGAQNTPQFAGLGNHIQLGRNEAADLVVNTVIKDREGNLIVEIIDNEWRVSSAAWEKNYTDDALEVKDGRGRVVFQLRLLPDRAEFQVEWWDGHGNGVRIVQQKDRPDSPESDKKGFVIVIMTPLFHPDDPAIQPIFKYPSRKYFGQLRQP